MLSGSVTTSALLRYNDTMLSAHEPASDAEPVGCSQFGLHDSSLPQLFNDNGGSNVVMRYF